MLHGIEYNVKGILVVQISDKNAIMINLLESDLVKGEGGWKIKAVQLLI